MTLKDAILNVISYVSGIFMVGYGIWFMYFDRVPLSDNDIRGILFVLLMFTGSNTISQCKFKK